MIAVIALLHFGAVWTGFYDWQFSTRIIWFDNVLHALVGITFAMCLLWFAHYQQWNLSPAQRIIVALVFVLVMAVAWELAEYLFFTQLTDYAYSLKIYSPSISEATSDIVSDLLGAGLFLTIVRSPQV